MKPHSHIQTKMFCIQKIFSFLIIKAKVFLNRKLLFININEKLFLSVNDIYRNVPTSSSSSSSPSSSSSCSKSFILLFHCWKISTKNYRDDCKKWNDEVFYENFFYSSSMISLAQVLSFHLFVPGSQI